MKLSFKKIFSCMLMLGMISFSNAALASEVTIVEKSVSLDKYNVNTPHAKHKKSHNHKSSHHKSSHHKSSHHKLPAVECCEEIKLEEKYNKVIFGISGDFGLGTNHGGNFNINSINIPVAADADPVITRGFEFSQRLDSMYGGNISIGSLIGNNLEYNFEVGYHQLSLCDKNNSLSKIERDIFGGFINLVYYMDINSILPFISAGVGILRNNVSGTLLDGDGSKFSFSDSVSVSFGYQLGLGISKMMKDGVLAGISYKLLWPAKIDGNDLSNITLVNGDTQTSLNGLPISMSNTVHNIQVSLKFTG